ncbi:unnamed protein product [Thelazia callipaeda]|uniref:Coatomer subunit zeta n=1 Tax=Thelazia callipaeda TaxID=103827 RepID=A0A0N5CRH4_THECL|nr:unnamed protein product [Thelazia callipaeda]
MCNSDFGALNIERVTQAHFNEVKRFMTIDFLHNEPLSKSINLSVEESDGLFDDIIQAGIASSLSYLLRTPDGNIAALRLVSILDQAEEKCTSEVCIYNFISLIQA